MVKASAALSYVVPDLGKLAMLEARVHAGRAGQDHLGEPEAAEMK